MGEMLGEMLLQHGDGRYEEMSAMRAEDEFEWKAERYSMLKGK